LVLDKLVITTTPNSSRLLQCLRDFSGTSFSWAYLGQSIGDFRRIQRCFEGRGSYLDTTDRFHQAADDLREPYLTYLYQIGRKLNSLHWWTTSLSYRNGYTSKTFHQACYLRVALDLVRNSGTDEPLVLVSDQPVLRALEDNLAGDEGVRVRVSGRGRYPWLRLVHDCLRILAHRAFFVFREGIRIVQARRMISRPYAPTEETTVLISWMTPGNLHQSGEFHRSFFGDLAQQLGKLGCRVAIAPIILREVRYKEALHRLRDGSLPVIVPHRYLGPIDLLQVVVASFARPPCPRSIPTLCGMEVRALVEEDLRTHWVSNGAADAMLMASVVRRWAELKFPIARIIYIFENQPYERAICWQARRSLPGATIVGYQHTRVAPLILQVNLAPGGEEEAPLPDWLVTLGKHTSRLLVSGGHAPESLRDGGALQMQGLLARRPDGGAATGRADRPTILVATARLEEAAELVDLAARLFNEDEGVKVILKYHPAFPFDEVDGWSRDQLPQHVSVSDQPITELMLKSSLIVYSSSTVCVEALVLGLPAIHLRTQFDLDIDALGAVPHLRLEATGLEELREKVRWLLDHREEYIAQHREQWDRFVEEMYGPVTEDTYRAFLEPSDALKEALDNRVSA